MFDVFSRLRTGWQQMGRTQRTRVKLVLIIPVVGLIFMAIQIVQTLTTEPQIRQYEVTPPTVAVPVVEPNLFPVDFALQPLITDDLFFGLHDQITKDFVIFQTLDPQKTDNVNVASTVQDINTLFGNPQTLEVSSYDINVNRTGTRSASALLRVTYKIAERRTAVNYTLLYEIEQTDDAEDPYKFTLYDANAKAAGASEASDAGERGETR